jgi:hypothetical protein
MLTLSVPAKVRLARRVTAKATAPGAGTLTSRIARGAKLVASGSRTVTGAGPATLRLKLRKGVRVKRLRGKKLVLRGRVGGGRRRDGVGASEAQGALRKSRSASRVDQNASSSQGRPVRSNTSTALASSVMRGCSVVRAA